MFFALQSFFSVPKPLKFLRPHFETLIQTFDAMVDGDNKSALADILSVLAMTFSKAGSRESLKYKMQGNSTDLGAWGHEYVRAIAGEIGQESQARAEKDAFGTNPDLLAMVQVIVPFHLQHNAEHEAVDLLLEVEQLSLLLEESAIDDKNYKRVCLCSGEDRFLEDDCINDLLLAVRATQHNTTLYTTQPRLFKTHMYTDTQKKTGVCICTVVCVAGGPRRDA